MMVWLHIFIARGLLTVQDWAGSGARGLHEPWFVRRDPRVGVGQVVGQERVVDLCVARVESV
jgi:hypothetical protein